MIRLKRLFKTSLFFGVILLLVFSCKKEEPVSPYDLIVGTWSISSATINATINDSSVIEYFTGIGKTQNEAEQIDSAFNAVWQQAFSGTLSLKSDDTYFISASQKTGVWQLSSSGDKLIFDANSVNEVDFEILSLDNNNLHMKFSQTRKEDFNNDGNFEMLVIYIDMKLTK